MTTKVTVDAHAGWPVEVTTLDWAEVPGREGLLSATKHKAVVAPHTTQDFYVHSHRTLEVREVQP